MDALAATRMWLDRAVIGLDLCPFARAPAARGQVRFALSGASDWPTLLGDLRSELALIAAAEPAEVETTLLVCPDVPASFDAFNQFLDDADEAVRSQGLEGVIQVASFHPQYRFADAPEDDVAHATNRSPWPTLHLLREDSVERAVLAVPDPAAIYEANMRTLRALTAEGWERLSAAWRAG